MLEHHMNRETKQINITQFYKFLSTENNMSNIYIQSKPHKIEFCFCIVWFLSNSYTVLTLKFEAILHCKCLYDDRAWPKGSAK